MMKLSATLQNQIVEFFVSLPNIEDNNTRRALIESAGLDSELQSQISFEGSSLQFFQLLIPTLIRFGKLEDGRDALISVLKAAQRCVGQNRRVDCDKLIQRAQGKYSQLTKLVNLIVISPKLLRPKLLWVFLLGLTAGIILFTYWHLTQSSLKPFKPETFGILVAEFEGGTEEEVEKGKQTQNDITSILNARFIELNIDDAVTKKIPTSIVSSVSSHEEARKIGKKYHAELIIWGQVNSQAIIPSLTLVNPLSDFTNMIKPEITLFKSTLSHAALSKIQDIRLPPLTNEPTLLVSFVTGMRYYHNAKYEEALRYFSLSLSEKNTEYIDIEPIFLYKGNSYLHIGAYDSAIIEFNKGLELSPEAFSYYNNRGTAYGCMGEHDKAITDYNRVLELNSDFAAAVYNNIGTLYIDTDEYNQAIAYFNRALKVDPNYTVVYINRGNLYNRKGQYDQAIADYSKALEIDPNVPEVYHNLGQAYQYKGEYDQAIDYLNKALKLNSDDIAAYISRGVNYRAKGKYDLAIDDYNAALELAPNEPLIYLNRSVVYNAKGEYDQAIADCTIALELDPNSPAYINRASAYSSKGEYVKAIADYTQVPSNFVVTYAKPPDVAILRFKNQSCVGIFPPSTSMPHCPCETARR